MGKSRLGQVWATRQYVKNRPWQRAREARRLREAEQAVTNQGSGSGEETKSPENSNGSEDYDKEESA
jgi:hypothetical protein